MTAPDDPSLPSRRNRWIAPVLAVLVSLLMVFSVLFLYNPSGYFANHYLPIGYYANHNRALATLDEMPSVEVIEESRLVDRSEDISFIRVRFESREILLGFNWKFFSFDWSSVGQRKVEFDDLFVGFPERLRGEVGPVFYGSTGHDARFAVGIDLVREARNRNSAGP